MNLDFLRSYCLAKKGVTEEFPFGPDTLVFKVAAKMFLLCSISEYPLSFNVKCDPERASELREAHACILPGYHMNKKHWNTIIVDGSLTINQLKEFIDHSYNLVVSGLSSKEKASIN